MTDVAFFASPAAWPWAWARHLRDHGGTATLLEIVTDPRRLYDSEWAVLLIDASLPLLDTSFVAEIHHQGRLVVGVFDPAIPHTKDRALAARVDAVVETDATADEFMRVVGALRTRRRPGRRPAPTPVETHRGPKVIAVGGPVGAPIVAIGVTRGLHNALLVDADDFAPSVAVRVGVAPVPNLLTAMLLDPAEDVTATVFDRDGLHVLGGMEPAHWSEAVGRFRNLLPRLGAYTSVCCTLGPVLGDVGERSHLSRSILASASAVIVTGEADPPGMTAALRWVADARMLAPAVAIYVALINAPHDRYRRSQIIATLRALDANENVALFTLHLSDDRRLRRAAWARRPLTDGPLARSLRRLGNDVAAAL